MNKKINYLFRFLKKRNKKKKNDKKFLIELILPTGKKILFEKAQLKTSNENIKTSYFHEENTISIAKNCILHINIENENQKTFFLYACSQVFIHSDDEKITINALKQIYELELVNSKKEFIPLKQKLKEIKKQLKSYNAKKEIGFFIEEISKFSELEEKKQIYETLIKYKLKIKE